MSDSSPAVDERLKSEGLGARIMKRPELGAIAGVILVTVFFLATADAAMFTTSGIINFMTPAMDSEGIEIHDFRQVIPFEVPISIVFFHCTCNGHRIANCKG